MRWPLLTIVLLLLLVLALRLGYTLASHLFSRGARVYMVCRSKERAEKARQAILTERGASAQPDNLRLLLGDVSLRGDVERVVAELGAQEKSIDCLVCNAGAMLDKRTPTADGVETTFACHFLFGTYWLASKCLPLLERGSDPRVVVVASGGMYTSKLPSWADVVSGGSGKFDGQAAYAKAKRVQVAFCERWAKQHPAVKVLCCHPGWTHTPGVDKAYGSFAQWLLEPLRSEWEGTEGIAWLCGAPAEQLKSGEFYLDGKVEPKHLHKSTVSTQAEEDAFFAAMDTFVTSLGKAPATIPPQQLVESAIIRP